MQETGRNRRTYQGYLTINLHTKGKGVMPQYDVRADKWEIAQNAMDRVNKERIAKGQQPPSEETNKEDTAKGGAKDAGQPT